MSLPVYPDLPRDVSSRITNIRDGRMIGQTVDGSPVLTLAHQNEKYDYRIVHSYLNQERWTVLQEFYEANRYTSFEWFFDGRLRTWKFLKKPIWAWATEAEILRTYTVDLVEL
ncbi:MAG: hypothetical protein LBE75_01820 [Burkholderiales bacterium]|jgi:hypothetical protein|nr:hypothetical protein [Burkholderiales bacterium]